MGHNKHHLFEGLWYWKDASHSHI